MRFNASMLAPAILLAALWSRPFPASASSPGSPTNQSSEALTLENPRVWSGLVGYPVNLTLYGGDVLSGKVMGQHQGGLLIARVYDGRVVNVERSDVRRATVDFDRYADVKLAPGLRKGTGLLATGIILIVLGAPVIVTGAVFMGIWPQELYLSLPMLLTGAPHLVAGVAMTAVGVERRKYWREAAVTSEYGMGFGRDFPNMPRGMSFQF